MTKKESGPAAGSTDLAGSLAPVCLQLAISGNLPPNYVIAHVESMDARRCGRSSVVKFSADDRRSRRLRRRGKCVDVRRRVLDGVATEGGDAGADSEGHVTGTVNQQQAINSPETEEWRKAQKKTKCKRI